MKINYRDFCKMLKIPCSKTIKRRMKMDEKTYLGEIKTEDGWKAFYYDPGAKIDTSKMEVVVETAEKVEVADEEENS